MITSPEEFIALRTSDEMDMQERASHDQASIETWNQIVDQFPDMRVWVAYNKTVPVEVLDRLATDPSARVRRQVAMRRKLSKQSFQLLATDTDEGVRAAVAQNKRAPASTIAQLAHDPCEFVRRAALESLQRQPDKK
jgi:hypothetical protein